LTRQTDRETDSIECGGKKIRAGRFSQCEREGKKEKEESSTRTDNEQAIQKRREREEAGVGDGKDADSTSLLGAFLPFPDCPVPWLNWSGVREQRRSSVDLLLCP